jgi:hypothetical protein
LDSDFFVQDEAWLRLHGRLIPGKTSALIIGQLHRLNSAFLGERAKPRQGAAHMVKMRLKVPRLRLYRDLGILAERDGRQGSFGLA